MASTAQDLLQRHRLTVADYHRMGETGILRPDARVELIEGEIIDMAPIGSPHASTVKRLIQLLTEAVHRTAIVSAQDPIILGDFAEPQPDLALLRPREDYYAGCHPGPEDILLVIEVADTTLRYDRQVKAPLYARHGIPELWLINLEERQLETYQGPNPNGYREIRILKEPGVIVPVSLPGVGIDLSGLFALI